MRPKRLSQDEIEVLHQLRDGGATYQSLAELQGCGKKTVYDALTGRKPPTAANDNHLDRNRVTRLTAHNGGRSHASGMMPVTLPRVATLGAPTVPMSAREFRLAANDNVGVAA